PDLYTTEELDGILLHEKVHSREKHSFDVLIANLFCVLFWFNPFVWLYKKVIIQNLEFIADQKAIQCYSDKTDYQKALLRVVTHQSYLSVTNHFNQSLIKKRIVMLNTSQSKKQNSIKYFFVVPVLICFIFLFQVRVIAQEKFTVQSINHSLDEIIVRMEINKHTTDEEMNKEKDIFKKEFDADLKFSKVKRNPKGEITSIKVYLK
ncbi:MAG: M56 family metallopeptidase, partial [Aequorivita sp.]|nr:M56 family metallopeptidase [Aequorivita sp.]